MLTKGQLGQSDTLRRIEDTTQINLVLSIITPQKGPYQFSLLIILIVHVVIFCITTVAQYLTVLHSSGSNIFWENIYLWLNINIYLS